VRCGAQSCAAPRSGPYAPGWSGRRREASDRCPTATPQRRDEHAGASQAKVQIAAEGTGGRERFEIAIGGGDDAAVDLAWPNAAQAGDLAVLDHAQQLGLHRQGHLADLVEEHGATVGGLEQTLFALHGASKRALFVAKELCLERGLGQGRAVDADEGAFLARGALVERRRKHIFADARLPQDEHVDVAGADELQ
jgi:hypothetical protein